MTLAQAAHEATKLIAAGLAITGGVIVEELAQDAIATIALLAPVAPLISAVIVGIVTGIVTVLVVHLLDRADMFGVIEQQRQTMPLDALDDRMNRFLTEIEASLEQSA